MGSASACCSPPIRNLAVGRKRTAASAPTTEPPRRCSLPARMEGDRRCPPEPSDLDEEGDLKYHTDFRSVYATLLDSGSASRARTCSGRSFRCRGRIGPSSQLRERCRWRGSLRLRLLDAQLSDSAFSALGFFRGEFLIAGQAFEEGDDCLLFFFIQVERLGAPSPPPRL